MYSKGTTIPADRVAELAGGSHRLDLLAFRKHLEDTHKIVSELLEDGSLKLLDDAEALRYVQLSREKHIRGIFRSAKRARECIQDSGLTPAEAQERDHHARVTAAAGRAARKASRDPLVEVLRRIPRNALVQLPKDVSVAEAAE